MELDGNLVPKAASTSQLAIETRAFRVNRLSFIVQVRDLERAPDCRIYVRPGTKVDHRVEVQHATPIIVIPVSLEQAQAVHLSTHLESDEVEKNIELAKQQAGRCFL
jgi:hypothetical protein